MDFAGGNMYGFDEAILAAFADAKKFTNKVCSSTE